MRDCLQCQESFEVTEHDTDFYRKVSPTISGQTIAVLPPTHCPSCREKRRLATRNDYSLYNRACSLCHKSIIAIYPTDTEYPVYCKECWWSDKWDASDFGVPYDFAQTFFSQFAQLRTSVPRLALINRNAENSEYINYASHNKNCYLIFNADGNQDCYYSDSIDDCRNCLDMYWSASCELSYELLACLTSYNSQFCLYSNALSDCYFCYYCDDCHDCFGCFGLAHKQYYIFNQAYSAEEYKKIMAALLLQKSSHQGLQILKQKVNDFFATLPHRYATISYSEDCTGDFLDRCKNCYDCYHINQAQDCKYISDGGQLKDSYDGNYCGYQNSELLYEVQDCWFGYRMLFSTTCWNCYEMYYSDHCFYSNNCFGCIGLRRKQYCIFNKQYSKEAYESLVPQLIAHMQKTGEWSEFFPTSISLFPNIQIEQSPDNQAGMPISQGSNLPDAIDDVSDTITESPLACNSCAKSYKILAQELEFYRSHQLTLPRYCFICRQKNRVASLLPRKLYPRQCQKCQVELASPYAPDRPETIFCTKCYQAEIRA